jgi:hypothetical protein
VVEHVTVERHAGGTVVRLHKLAESNKSGTLISCKT